jgi:hypothetical protein
MDTSGDTREGADMSDQPRVGPDVPAADTATAVGTAPAGTPAPVPERKTVAQKAVASVFPLVAVLLVIVFFNKASGGGYGKTYAFPLVMMGLTAVFAVVALISVWWPRRNRPSATTAAATIAASGASIDEDDDRTPEQVKEDSRIGMRQALLILVCFLGLVILLQYVGILVASAVFMIVVMPLLGYRKPIYVVAIAAGVTVAVWLIFEQFLMISLPAGPWGF